MTVSAEAYVFDNDRPTAAEMLDHLSAILDPVTTRRLTRLGVSDGWRCLEVGAGNGSIAGWLADQVGPTGQVIATDVNPVRVRAHPGVDVLRHDVSAEELPEGPFHVIHARLVLAHLPHRADVLFRMADRLARGGALVVEEWGATGPAVVLDAVDPDATGLLDRYQKALVAVLRAQGNDGTWALRVPAVMADAGLVNVDTELSARSWRGGTAGCRLPVTVGRDLRDRLTTSGITGGELDRLARILGDERTLVAGNLTASTAGNRP